MKLFMFYPNDYCRMYVLARDKDHVCKMYGLLFDKYFKMEYSGWIDPDDEDEQDYIEQKRERFFEGLSKAEEVTDGIAIDAHY